ncbi:hypothetical protein EVAR_58797_1 [Eumeta japonica]|uniref:Uncharacterized protein n=1 Tax=Eumeta variegata TaxID=151549 RepID=A0A4C1YH73_EUMVA|nr:hypothetical protein EVAR_58797_1 [Eumeta japonica]
MYTYLQVTNYFGFREIYYIYGNNRTLSDILPVSDRYGTSGVSEVGSERPNGPVQCSPADKVRPRPQPGAPRSTGRIGTGFRRPSGLGSLSQASYGSRAATGHSRSGAKTWLRCGDAQSVVRNVIRYAGRVAQRGLMENNLETTSGAPANAHGPVGRS